LRLTPLNPQIADNVPLKGGPFPEFRYWLVLPVIKEKSRRTEKTAYGRTVGEAVRHIGVTEQTYLRWRKKCSGMNNYQVRRLSKCWA
jgi:hypothetical protein